MFTPQSAVDAFLGLANPSAVSFLKINADNTATFRSAANFRTDLGLGIGDSPAFTAITGPGGDKSVITPQTNAVRIDQVGGSNALTLIAGQSNLFAGLGTVSSGTILSFQPISGILEQIYGTTSQAFRVYNTYTDGSNYERAVFGFAANTLFIGTQQAGTGSVRGVEFLVGGSTYLNLTGGNVNIGVGGLICTAATSFFISAASGQNIAIAPTGGGNVLVYSSLYFQDGSQGFSRPALGALSIVSGGLSRMVFTNAGEIVPVLPTSSAGLVTGALWNDSGTVKVA